MARQGTLYLFMLLMLITGALNALLMKHQHMQKSPMEPGGAPEHFSQPFLQASFMMVGEFLCLLVYLATRDQAEVELSSHVPKWIFLVPCCCDWIATALICMGYALIAVSVAQMCRGAVVIFTCLLSIAVLGRRQHGYHVVGVAMVVLGITLVSLSALTNPGGGEGGGEGALLGISLCVFAQIFQASMYVYEEKIMTQYEVQPLQVVGWEGTFGMFIGAAVLAVLYPMGYANTPGAFHQMHANHVLTLSVIASVFAVALFNFAGATVTKRASAVARSTIKISSTILIWMVELYMGWNTFSYLQFSGFVFVACGTLLYNKIVTVPFLMPDEELTALMGKSEKTSSAAEQ